MAKRYALRDDQCEQIKNLLPRQASTIGVTAKNNQLFVEVVLYRYGSGIPWWDLPERFVDFRVVHICFSHWSKECIWQKVSEMLSHESDNEYAMLDSTIVCSSTQCQNKEQAIGRSKCGLSTKMHSCTDALGNPTGFYLTARQDHDLNGAEILLDLPIS